MLFLEAAVLVLLYALRGHVEIPTACVALAWSAAAYTVIVNMWKAARAFDKNLETERQKRQ